MMGSRLDDLAQAQQNVLSMIQKLHNGQQEEDNGETLL
jgi:hypothetical protein